MPEVTQRCQLRKNCGFSVLACGRAPREQQEEGESTRTAVLAARTSCLKQTCRRVFLPADYTRRSAFTFWFPVCAVLPGG